MAQFRFHNEGMEKLFNTYIEKGYRKGSFIDYWDKNANLFPEKEALVDSQKRLTWSQVKTLSDRLALALLELGLNRDDIIGVQLPWSIEFCLMRAAHEKAGIIQMELAPTLKHREVAHHLATTEAKAMVIPWKYRNFDYYSMIEEIRYKLPHLKHIIIVGEVPSAHVISFDEMLQNPLEQKYPESYLSKSRHTPFELDGLRHTTGTTGIPKLIQSNSACLEWAGRAHLSETGEKINSDTICGIICPAITGPNVFTFYSSSIVGARIVLLEQFRSESALELIEKERINVIGVVPAQLTMMMQHPDFDKYDKNGNLVLVGREKDIIIRGGQNIYPLEVENLLSTNPKVSQVAIISMPDPVMGEKACVFTVLKEGERLSFDEMVAFLKEKNITPYKIPERLEIIDKMPLAGEQKTDKKTLEKKFIQILE